MKRPGGRRASRADRLLVGAGGSLLVAATMLLAPTATAAATAAPVPTDHGGLHRSTLAPMVPPGCALVDVDLPLVEGVTWWVQTVDMVVVAEIPQPLDPTATTTLVAVLSPGYVFEDGLTSAQWLVAPRGGDVSTGCVRPPDPPPVVVPPVVVLPVVVPPVVVLPVVVPPVVVPPVVVPPVVVPPVVVPPVQVDPVPRGIGSVAVAPPAAEAVPAAEALPAPVPGTVGVVVSSGAVATPGGSPPDLGPFGGTAADQPVGSTPARTTDRVAAAVVSSARPGSLSSGDLVAGLVLAVLASAAVAVTLHRGRAPSDGQARTNLAR